MRQRKEAEELVKRRREELEKVKKEKEEACSVGQNFMRLYEEEARRRKGTEEELSKVAAEKDAASSVCSEILLLLQSYTRRHGTPSGFSDEDSVTRQPPSYFICPISQVCGPGPPWVHCSNESIVTEQTYIRCLEVNACLFINSGSNARASCCSRWFHL